MSKISLIKQYFLSVCTVIFLHDPLLGQTTSHELQINYTTSPYKILFADPFSVNIEVLTKDKKTKILFSKIPDTIFQNFQLLDIKQVSNIFSKKEKKYGNSLILILQPIQTNYIQIPPIPISILPHSSNLYSINTDPILVNVQSRLTEGANHQIHPIRMNHFSYMQSKFWKVYFFLFGIFLTVLYLLWKILYKILYSQTIMFTANQQKIRFVQEVFYFSEDFLLKKKHCTKEFLDLLLLCLNQYSLTSSSLDSSTAELMKEITNLRFSPQKLSILNLTPYLEQTKKLLQGN